MIPEKGILELVDELAAAPDAWSAARIGAPPQDPAYRERVERRVAELGLGDRVALVGEVTDLDAFFASVSVLVVPSTGNEGQPTVILEALLHGRPVIVRAPIWSSTYAGLPVAPYTTADELAHRLRAPLDGPVDVDAIAERFGGGREILDAITAASGASSAASPRSSYHDWHAEPGYSRDVTRHFPSGARVLDIGCGTAWIAEHFDDYTGLDSSRSAVDEARRLGRNAILHSVDEPLPFPDGTFDAVVLKDLLEHVADPVAVVSEALRVLRPGGRAFASSPDAQRWVWDDYTHRRPFTRKSYRLLFRDSGFEVERIGYESVMPGIGIVSGFTRRRQRPRPLAALAALPVVRRNVYALARKPLGAQPSVTR
jgi:SAM-dependent methyltransferase